MNSIVDPILFPLSNKPSNQTVKDRMEHYLFIRKSTSNRLVLYSHGNATTLEGIGSMMQSLAEEANVNVLAYEYPGYGTCTGMATPESVKIAILKAFNAAVNTYEFSPENIILMGRSIGTGPTLWLYNHLKFPISDIVLISPFTSIMDMIRRHPINMCGLQHLASMLYTEAFANIDYIVDFKGRLLLIHGQDDDVIPMDMSLELYEVCSAETHDKFLCIVSGGTHNQLVWDVKEISIFLNNRQKVSFAQKRATKTISKNANN